MISRSCLILGRRDHYISLGWNSHFGTCCFGQDNYATEGLGSVVAKQGGLEAQNAGGRKCGWQDFKVP